MTGLPRAARPPANWVARGWPWLGIAAAYAVTRLVGLTRMPLFADEGIYLWWARQLLLGDLSRGWGQGKPLSGWLIALPLALGQSEVMATRLAGVVVGALGLGATAHLSARALSPRVALAVGVLWVLLPYTLFFERLATPDVVLGCLAMLALDIIWQALHADRVRPGLALAGGLSLIVTALAKLPVSFFFFGLPAGVLVVSGSARRRAGLTNAALVYVLPALFAAGVLAVGLYRWAAGARPIGFGFDEILLKSATTIPRGTLILGNVATFLSWGGPYLTWPVAMALLAAWVAAWFGPPLVRLLAGAAGLWIAILVCAASFWVPRYVWPVLPALLVVLGWAMAAVVDVVSKWLSARRGDVEPQLAYVYIGVAASLVLALTTTPLDWPMLFDPTHANLPAIDRDQYIAGVGAGYGIADAATYLDVALGSNPKTSQIVAVAIDGESRLRTSLPAKWWPKVRQVQIISDQNLDSAHQIDTLRTWLSDTGTTYVVVTSQTQWTPEWQQAFPQAVLEKIFPKPGGADSVEVWRITAP